MTLSDQLALKLRIAKAYQNTDSNTLAEATGINANKIRRYCNGVFNYRCLEEYEQLLSTMGYEIEIKMRKAGE